MIPIGRLTGTQNPHIRVAAALFVLGALSTMTLSGSATAATPQAGPPVEGSMNLTIDGRPVTLKHWPHPVRSQDFRVSAQVDDGSLVEVKPQPARTIRGTIAEMPGAIVAGSLLEDGLHAGLFHPDGRVHWIEPGTRPHDETGGTSDGIHVVSDAVEVIAFASHLDSAQRPGQGEHEPMFSFECKVAQIAFDADFQMYAMHNSSVEDVVNRIEAILTAVNMQFENEVGIIHEVTEIIIRTSAAQDPYTSNNPFTLLHQFRNIWNTPPENAIVRDIAHLYTGKNLEGPGTGIAFLGAVCDDLNAYAVVRDQPIDFPCMTDIAARLLAINWNATHCECPGTTMHTMPSCANTFIGPGSDSVELILAFKDSLDCLEPCLPECEPPDLNCDGSVGVADLLILLSAWGPCDDCTPGACPADLTGDCAVGVGDLLILLANWG